MAELALPATCGICNQKFYGPRLNLVGQAHGRQQQFLEQLAQHITAEHDEVATGIGLLAAEVQGMSILSYYRIDDPDLQRALDVSRWNVHQKTLNMRFSDQQIADWVSQITPQLVTLAQMGDAAGIQKNLVGMLQSMRDGLEEPNRYILTGQALQSVS